MKNIAIMTLFLHVLLALHHICTNMTHKLHMHINFLHICGINIKNNDEDGNKCAFNVQYFNLLLCKEKKHKQVAILGGYTS